jgi:hypothetical protein
LQTYHQQVSQAIIDWNWDFFREVAQAMEFVEHKELDTLRFVFLAARGLFMRRASDEITKRDVRQLALRWWAVERLCIRQPHRKKELIPLVFQEAAHPRPETARTARPTQSTSCAQIPLGSFEKARHTRLSFPFLGELIKPS